MEKIKVQSIVSAVFKIDNSEDTEKAFPIEAEVTVGAEGVEAIYNGAGYPEKGGRVTFHEYRGGESGIGFENIPGTRERIEIMGAVDSFCQTVRTRAAGLLGKTAVTD